MKERLIVDYEKLLSDTLRDIKPCHLNSGGAKSMGVGFNVYHEEDEGWITGSLSVDMWIIKEMTPRQLFMGHFVLGNLHQITNFREIIYNVMFVVDGDDKETPAGRVIMTFSESLLEE